MLASTHSPLVIQGVDSNEIVSLHLSGQDVFSAELGDYYGSSIEDLLTAEELFSTDPYSIAVEKIRAEYHELIKKSELSEAEQERLRCLGRELMGLRILSPLGEDETIQQLEARLLEMDNDSDQ